MATERVFYKGKKELTMAQFEALTSLDDAVDYNITDFPNGGITNAQMTTALGYSRLFDDGEVFICLDNGTYSKGHTYQVKVTNGVKSWEDITPSGSPFTNSTFESTENGKKLLLYKHELVIPYSFSVTDPANGAATVNGSVIYHYLSNTGTQITSASGIDDNFMLSGGIGKNSANTVLLFDVNVTKAGNSITAESVSASTMGYITGTVGTITDTITQLI